jgi:hypothetical protein
MVKIEESKGSSGESFTRIFGNERMGALFSKVQASVIRSGFELEEEIYAAVSPEIVTTLDSLNDISQDTNNKPPIQIVFKPEKPDPDDKKKSVQADFLIVDNLARRFSLVEVKEGHVFDTKKADGEVASLKNITSWLAQEFAYRTHYYLCSFNQESREEIVLGTKKRFTLDHVLTGREFCDMINIDYDKLREKRTANQEANRLYFLHSLLTIPEIRQEIIELLSSSE